MQTATVSIAQVYPPGQGKTNWAIVGSDGIRYSVPPLFGPQLRQGDSVALDYKMNQFNGKDIRMVEKVSFMGNRPLPAQSSAPGAISYPVGDPRPEPPPHGSNHVPKPHTQERGMALMGIVGRAMGSGQFGVLDIKPLMLAVADAWDEATSR